MSTSAAHVVRLTAVSIVACVFAACPAHAGSANDALITLGGFGAINIRGDDIDPAPIVPDIPAEAYEFFEQAFRIRVTPHPFSSPPTGGLRPGDFLPPPPASPIDFIRAVVGGAGMRVVPSRVTNLGELEYPFNFLSFLIATVDESDTPIPARITATFDSGQVFSFDNGAGFEGIRILHVGPGDISPVTFTSSAGTVAFDRIAYGYVPEPASAVALLPFCLAMRRRRRS
jgi:hypothetical protein